MTSRHPNGAAFHIEDTKIWVAKPPRGSKRETVLLFAVGDDTPTAAAEFFNPSVADEFIRVLTNAINSLPHEARNAIADAVEAGTKK